MKWEVEKSLELGKKVVAVDAGPNYSGPMPAWIRSRSIKVVPWTRLTPELRR